MSCTASTQPRSHPARDHQPIASTSTSQAFAGRGGTHHRPSTHPRAHLLGGRSRSSSRPAATSRIRPARDRHGLVMPSCATEACGRAERTGRCCTLPEDTGWGQRPRSTDPIRVGMTGPNSRGGVQYHTVRPWTPSLNQRTPGKVERLPGRRVRPSHAPLWVSVSPVANCLCPTHPRRHRLSRGRARPNLLRNPPDGPWQQGEPRTTIEFDVWLDGGAKMVGYAYHCTRCDAAEERRPLSRATPSRPCSLVGRCAGTISVDAQLDTTAKRLAMLRAQPRTGTGAGADSRMMAQLLHLPPRRRDLCRHPRRARYLP
jgi:hypothetical protein